MWKTRISGIRCRDRRLRFSSGIIILALVALFVSCDVMAGIVMDLPPSSPGELPPFVITKPVVEIIGRSFHFRYAAVTFDFLNQAPEIVDRVIVSFMLYNPRTLENPFLGSNKFEITRREIVLPNEAKEIIISLDGFIHIAPTEPYLIDYFYIYEIHYVDGSVWQDKYGKFRVRGVK